MSYEVATASSGGDDTTLAKPFIISLENATGNWYVRLPPRSITSWAMLKEKFLVNFQDFFACQQYKRETLLDFFHRFLQLKAQAPEVSDEQAIMQSIKALRVGQLHSHLVMERLRTLEELYEEFQKFSRAECYTFVNWARKEKPQTKMKVQGHSSTARAKKAHRVLTHHTNKLTASTHMDAD
jgi:hypothetical protein